MGFRRTNQLITALLEGYGAREVLARLGRGIPKVCLKREGMAPQDVPVVFVTRSGVALHGGPAPGWSSDDWSWASEVILFNTAEGDTEGSFGLDDESRCDWRFLGNFDELRRS